MIRLKPVPQNFEVLLHLEPTTDAVYYDSRLFLDIDAAEQAASRHLDRQDNLSKELYSKGIVGKDAIDRLNNQFS